MSRRRVVGAEVVAGGVEFRVWAPARERVAVVIDGRDFPLDRDANGYFRVVVADARAGTLYKFRLDGERETYPDPASRFQPEGVHGPSQVIDPSTYAWRDQHWRGIDTKGRVLYELHVGTFTREGTYAAAAKHFAKLAEIGINTIELMPVHEFAGNFGWSYDGVDLYAPTRLYGQPDDLRRFVDDAHALGIGVILDVVYNHFGPDGSYVKQFTPSYFTDRYECEWGDAINFDGDDAHGVRTFFTENAAYWIDEFHFDGLRLDATQSIHDNPQLLSLSPPRGERVAEGRVRGHILAEIVTCARNAANNRNILIVAENEPQDRRLLTDYGVDALWNDDWHHSARVAATGFREAYYTDYHGTPQEFLSMVKRGFLYQGQWYSWQKQPRGTRSDDIAPERMICFLENHDQVANTQRGERLPYNKALTPLLLLQPQTPMLFQGQELVSPPRFHYFADHKPELAKLVAEGRREFMSQFPSIDLRAIPDPGDRALFEASKLDHAQCLDEIRELLALRREEPFKQQRNDWLHGAVLRDDVLLLRWLTGGEHDRLLLVNFGEPFDWKLQNDPLLAPPEGFASWESVWRDVLWKPSRQRVTRS